jgi:hypothetical protein
MVVDALTLLLAVIGLAVKAAVPQAGPVQAPPSCPQIPGTHHSDSDAIGECSICAMSHSPSRGGYGRERGSGCLHDANRIAVPSAAHRSSRGDCRTRQHAIRRLFPE